MNKSQKRMDISIELYLLYEHMLNVAAKMDYYGGFNTDMFVHSAELTEAAIVVKSWGTSIEQNLINGKKQKAKKSV